MKPGTMITDSASLSVAALGPYANLSDLQKSMLDATFDCIKLLSPDGKLLAMNRAGCLALGVAEDACGGLEWLSLLPPDVREPGTKALQVANTGQPARFPGRSEMPGSEIFWDNLLTPICNASGTVEFIICISRDVTEKFKLERHLEEAIDREKLLSGEMRHRIKNLFAVGLGLIHITDKETAGNAQGDFAAILSDKFQALSRASDAAFGREATDGQDVCLAEVLSCTLLPYGDRCRLDGPPVSVTSECVTDIALVLHELATNAVKYGALGSHGGHVEVSWKDRDGHLFLTWTEHGGPQVPSSVPRQGFGTRMVDGVVRFARGEIERQWHPDGLAVTLRLPCVAHA